MKKEALIAATIVTVLALLLGFGRACNMEDTRNKEMIRKATIECLRTGTDALHCDRIIK